MSKWSAWALLGLVAFFIYGHYAEKEAKRAQMEADRRAFEQERASHPVPEWALAGCMANNASPAAQIEMARVVKHYDDNTSMSMEEYKSYMTLRAALLERCLPTYRDKLIAAYPQGLEQRVLDRTFADVMRTDPEVKRWLTLQREADDASKRVYIKE